MITDFIISVVVAVVSAFDSLLPSFSTPTWFGSDGFGSTVAAFIGGMLSPIYSWFPVAAIVAVLQGLFTLLYVFCAYAVFEWVWSHVPTIAGFGTGNG